MPEGIQTFYGPWSISVVQKVAAFSQRFRIRGSDASDGYHAGVPGTVLPRVSGTEWTLSLEWNDDVGSGWQPSELRKGARYTVTEGLIVTLGVDDNFLSRRDHDFDDLVLVLRSLDPAVHPIPLATPPLSFEIPGHGKPFPDGGDCDPPPRPCDPPPDPCKPHGHEHGQGHGYGHGQEHGRGRAK